ncbi:hypothetical protein HJC23_000614 [Cyclotella cryptica]|uniref:HMG box domain-containing protein n=1 Tax=Cyclotella cryptica TaxID=29204 RepID=A0ABD3Q8U8_9STRA
MLMSQHQKSSVTKHKSENIHGSSSIPPKPQRPLTMYNLFCILERNYILQQNQKPAHVPSDGPHDNTHVDPYLATRPARYRDLVLPPNWFVVGMNRVSRSKRVNHGVISFKNLSAAISRRWNAVDDETKLYCIRIAADELERYRRDKARYLEMYGTGAVSAQKRTYKKRSPGSGTDHYNGGGFVDCQESEGGGRLQRGETAKGLAVDRNGFEYGDCAPMLYLSDVTGLMPPVSLSQTHAQHTQRIQATAPQRSSFCNPDNTCTNSGHSSQYSYRWSTNTARKPTLDDILPDDRETAFALVGNNYNNILRGNELEKAFDDSDCE